MSMTRVTRHCGIAAAAIALAACTDDSPSGPPDGDEMLDAELVAALATHDFTGRVELEVDERRGRPVDTELAEAGRLLFFDPVTSLADNTCAGCHAPNASFADGQSITIGVDNNGIVGPSRTGPRNMRRSPTVLNTVLFPRLMLNSRFESLSGDPFDNSAGFLFPDPEGTSLSHLPHLMAAQAFLPVIDEIEMAGDDFEGTRDEMRAEIARRVDAIDEYREQFGIVYPGIAEGAPITFDHIGLAMAEFQSTLVAADAPIDRFARGEHDALTAAQKRGALLFFGEAGCVECHAVNTEFASGNEMFTDYREHVIGVPQIVPDVTNAEFDGPGANEDFGLEQVTEDPADRYAFRTMPLRNVAIQATFMHNGAFITLEDAIRHHLDAINSAQNYAPTDLPPDLQNLGPIDPVLERLDPRIANAPSLDETEFRDLLDFVCTGLLDEDAFPDRFTHLIPGSVPSGLPVHTFEPMVIGNPCLAM